MTQGVLVTSSEWSIFEANIPDAQDILNALVKYTPKQNPTLGRWTGPAPRITRKAALGGFETDVAWLYQWPDNQFTAQNLADLKTTLKSEVESGLGELSSTWSEVNLVPYSEALHGPVSFWASGRAAVTTTRDVVPTTTGRLGTPDNPVGPTTDATHPLTPGQIAAGAGGLFKSPLFWWGAGLITLVVVGPYIKPLFRSLGDAET